MSFRRVAIVTGAAQGIGRAIALRFAKDGMNVAVCDLPSKQPGLEAVVQDIQAHGRTAMALHADVAVEKDVSNMVDIVAGKLGGLDVMVANAGITIKKSFLETTLEDLDTMSSVNFKGVFLCYKAAARVMIAQNRGGRIIGASSVAGKMGLPELTAYCASKFAVRALTQTAAIEFGRFGITVNAYAPGLIDTPMMHNAVRRGLDVKSLGARAILARPGEPEEIANAVSFLASKESSFITGQTISVDGGAHFD